MEESWFQAHRFLCLSFLLIVIGLLTVEAAYRQTYIPARVENVVEESSGQAVQPAGIRTAENGRYLVQVSYPDSSGKERQADISISTRHPVSLPLKGETINVTELFGKLVVYPSKTLTTAGFTVAIISSLLFLTSAVMHIMEWVRKARDRKTHDAQE